MFKIDKSYIARKVKQSGYILPASVDINCPKCSRSVTFSLRWRVRSDSTCMFTTSRCPGCSTDATFLILHLDSLKEKELSGDFFIHPSPKTRKEIDGLNQIEDFNDGLVRAYRSAINVYNVNEWNSTATNTRRTLEGITKQILPEKIRNKPLAFQIRELPNYINLEEPILNLAESLKEGGNIGAHFDLEKETNQEMAELMLDFLDYLIEYLFILPKETKELEDKIEELDKTN